jgi:hypothetical protein
MACSATTKAGKPCRWATFLDRDTCVSHSAQAGDEDALAEMRARNGKSRAAQEASRRRRADPVPLATAVQIRNYVEELAGQARGAGGDVSKRVSAGVAAALCAARLLERELEKNAADLRKLIEAHPTEARVLGLVR